MKISFSDKASEKVKFYPYVEGIDLYKYIPDILIEKIKHDEDILNSKFANKRYFINNEDITIINIGKINDFNYETLRRFSSLIYKLSINSYYEEFIDVFLFPELWNLDAEKCFFASYEGIKLSEYSYRTFKSKKNKKYNLKKVNYILKNKLSNYTDIIKKVDILTDSINFVRDIVNGPANIVDITYLEDFIINLFKNNKVSTQILHMDQLKKMGFNLHLAVGNAGRHKPRLIELHYNKNSNKPKICIIGKGIVFDTGGLNLKPQDSMDDMKSDMAGAAIVIGLINAAYKLDIDINIIGLIPLAENCIDSNSYRPGDVIIGYNKKSVEIKNTDAEGRLLLADSLSYSDTLNCDLVIDIATLTGSTIIALGSKITAGFFKTKLYKNIFFDALKETDEALWELPLFEDYQDMLKSDIADLSNIGYPRREAGTIISALFLKEFIKNENWIHLDIAGPSFLNNDYHYWSKGATGIMIRTIIKFLEILSK